MDKRYEQPGNVSDEDVSGAKDGCTSFFKAEQNGLLEANSSTKSFSNAWVH